MALTLEYVRSKSAPKLVGLTPVVRAAAEALIDRCYMRGVPIIITQGLRTYAEQNALYAQGRTRPGPVVTNARGGFSNHNFGVAVDFALLLADGRTVSWDTLRDADKDSLPDWSEVVEEAKKLGFSWGGDWRSFRDMPHLEMTFGLTTAQYRAGLNPAPRIIAAALARIKPIETVEESGEMTAEEKAAFKALENVVKAQAERIIALESRDKMPTVPKWAESACEAAKAAGVIDTASGGSYDFYRLITVLHRRGFFKEAK